MSAVQEITLSNVGPVQNLKVTIPAAGLLIFKGRNGCGKTTVLEAVDSLITGRGSVPVLDGQARGEVSGFGAKVTFGRTSRRSGELIVESLDGKFDISTLIDPGMKSPEAADARRIKALVSITNVLPSAELFHPLLGGKDELEKFVGTAALASEDLVTMADRIKRDLEAAARKEESQAEHADGRARGAREGAAGVDVKAPCEANALQAVLETAIQAESKLKAEAEASARAAKAAKLAGDQLEDAEAKHEGLSLAVAKEQEAAAGKQVDAATTAVRDAEEALRVAKQAFETARNEYSQAIVRRKNAEDYEELVAQWRQQIATSIPTAPTAEELGMASGRVITARQSVEQGALIRRAKQQLAEGDKYAADAKTHRQAAERLRTAAGRTDEILSDVIAKSGSQLRVEGGRLVLDTRRGATYFHDLSDGERSIIAVDIGVDAVGSRGVLTLAQPIFESLDPTNRKRLAAHCVERGVVVLTAEASDDEAIRSEVFDASVN